MLEGVPGSRRVTLGADKGYDTQDFYYHVSAHECNTACGQGKTSKLDGRTTRHTGYQTSQRIRKRVEEIFGWVKTVGGGRKLKIQRHGT